MDYFKQLLELLKLEQEEDRHSYFELTASTSVNERRADGLTWYPIAIRGTEMSRGDYLTVEVERTTHQDIVHQMRFGASAVLFSQHDARNNRQEGVISYISGNLMKITLRTDELPDWSRDGKLGIDLLFDENSYDEMRNALQLANTRREKKEGRLIRILTGEESPEFSKATPPVSIPRLNDSQREAVQNILAAQDLAIVHGPPGTGKTTTLVQAIKTMLQQEPQQILVVAPSNTAVDLLSEKLSDEGLNVLRVGNPARVSDKLMSLMLDSKMAEHSSMKEIRQWRKQANAYRDMAQKYKRNFGKAEREQRKALFDEARSIMKQVEQTEQYIVNDLITRSQVITATLVGSNHYTVKHLAYKTVVVDEAGQALEPACWIPILKAQKLILAGDPHQLPPTVKSNDAAKKGLSQTLLEKAMALHPGTVAVLQEQYRMHEHIMGYSSNVFYKKSLQAHASVARHTLFTEDTPLVFVDTAGCGFEEQAEGHSICNPEEAGLLMKHLGILAEDLAAHYDTDDFPTIAVISPYKEQVHLLKSLLQQQPSLQPYNRKIAVNTIDSFQGQERDIVYISMARSNMEQKIGFLSDIRRMNVAMTRARKKLVVVGDSATLTADPFYANFIAYAEALDAYQSAWELS